jgi:glycosyltransferase involved in cell wall biosynthesis
MDLTRPSLSVVLPVFNEERNVVAMAACLADIARPFGRWEILFIDDSSTDRTLAEVKSLAARDPRVRFVAFTRNFGHQAALRAGLRYARGDAVVLMDCDFEHPPELIPAMVAEWRKGAKIVVTQRVSTPEQLSFLKSLTSRWFYWLLDAIGDIRIEPGSADFLLLDRVVVDTINHFETQEIFLRGIVRWLGYPLAKLTFTQGARHAGESKFTFRRMIDFAVMGIIAHSIKPLRIAIYLSLGFAAIGVLLMIYSLVSFLWIGHTVAGWTSIMSAIALLGAGQFLVLGIIGEYLGRLLSEARKWPAYLVAETEESTGPAEGDPARDTARAARA